MYPIHLFIAMDIAGNILVLKLVSYSFTSKNIYFFEIRSCHTHSTKPVTVKYFFHIIYIQAIGATETD